MPVRSVYDRVGLERLIRRQYGLVTRQQALECGMTEKALRCVLGKPGGWQVLLPGVYLTVRGTPTVDQRDKAALLYAGKGSVITGIAALRRHNVRCAETDVTDVLIPANVHRKSTGFVRVLRSDRMPETYWTEAGMRIAYLPRAVGDAARGSRDFREVQALVCAVIQQTSCTVPHLIKELNAGPTIGSRLFRAALAEVSDGVRSTAEGDLKRLVDRAGIEKPLYNPMLYLPDGTFLCSPDLWWERYGVAAEVDSLAYHFSARDYENTNKRHNRIERAGLHLLHWIPRTIQREGDTVLSDIREALASYATQPPPPIITVPAGSPAPPGCRPPWQGRR
jgi:hypothetical protein